MRTLNPSLLFIFILLSFVGCVDKNTSAGLTVAMKVMVIHSLRRRYPGMFVVSTVKDCGKRNLKTNPKDS